MDLMHGTKKELLEQLLELRKRVVWLEKTEEALRKSKEKYRSLFNEVTDMIHVVDMNGNIVDANPAELKTLGYKKREIIGKPLVDIVHPDYRLITSEMFKKVLSGKKIKAYETALRTKQGVRIDVEVSVAPQIENGKIVGARAIIRDITERKKAEMAIRESENKFRGIAEKSLVGIYLIQDGVFKYVNPKMAELFGYSVDELMDRKGPRDLTLPEDWSMAEENMKKRMSGKVDAIRYQFRGIRKDKRTIFVEVYGSRTTYQGKPAIVGTLLDITDAKLAEESLYKSNKLLTTTLNTILDAIIIVDLDYKIVSCNKSTFRVLGYTPDELIGKNCSIIKPGKKYEGIDRIAHYEELSEKGYLIRDDFYFKKKNGKVFPALFSIAIVKDGQGGSTGMVGTIHDITDRKQAEEKEKKLLEQQVAINQLALALGEVHDLEKMYRIIYKHVNRLMDVGAFIISYFDSKEKLIKAGFVIVDGKVRKTENFPPIPLEEKGYGIQSQVIRTGKPIHCTDWDEALKRVKTVYDIQKDGTVKQGFPPGKERTDATNSAILVPMKIAKKVIGILQVQSKRPNAYSEEDVSLLSGMANVSAIAIQNTRLYKEVQRELAERKQAEEKFRTLFEESRDAIYISEKKGTIIEMNQAGLNLFGYSRDEMMGMKVTNLYVDPNERKRFIKEIDRIGYVEDFEAMLRKKDGTDMICLISAVVRRDAAGKIIGYQGIIRDVTESKRINRELKQALVKAQQAEKVKSLFLANMSHEIRTPLNAILGFTDLLEQRIGPNVGPEEKSFFETIRNSGNRLMRTVHEILDMSQIETGTMELKPKLLNLERVIKNVIIEMSSFAENKGLELTFSSTAKDPVIKADEYCITQAISNIVDNAVKYTEKGGVDISLKSRNKQLVLSIRDTGIGMSRDYVQRMFEIFSQESTGYTKKFQGVGLGLALVKQYLDMNNVTIKVNSKKGVGTKFTLFFSRA
ncbi:MAG: PAS domain S-box protein [FCB group bacterium]|nr:PAS domain S-box protein [FCB group bacterium]